MPSILLSLGEGIEARVLQFDAKHIIVSSPRAFPPGTPVPVSGLGGIVFQIKVRRCVRVASEGGVGYFRLEGRFVNLSREQFQSVFHPASLGHE